MVIAIDGPAGSGKSALATMIAERLHYFLLNSGYFYRAVTYKSITGQIAHNDGKALALLAENTTFKLDNGKFLVDNNDLSPFLHSDEISKAVASVSSYEELREVLNRKMRLLAEGRDVVCEGRDMTTVVFPDAEVKIYLDASVKVRAKRRFDQRVSSMSLDEIEKTIHDRDEIDKNKKIGALKIASDAYYIDSSDLSLEEIYDKIFTMIKQKNRSL
jgi:cytidylate kinase